MHYLLAAIITLAASTTASPLTPEVQAAHPKWGYCGYYQSASNANMTLTPDGKTVDPEDVLPIKGFGECQENTANSAELTDYFSIYTDCLECSWYKEHGCHDTDYLPNSPMKKPVMDWGSKMPVHKQNEWKSFKC